MKAIPPSLVAPAGADLTTIGAFFAARPVAALREKGPALSAPFSVGSESGTCSDLIHATGDQRNVTVAMATVAWFIATSSPAPLKTAACCIEAGHRSSNLPAGNSYDLDQKHTVNRW